MRRCVQFLGSRGVAALVAAALCLASSPSGAAWYKATSPSFVIYSYVSEEDVKASALRLEKFDALLRFLNRRLELPPAETKLPVYLIRGTGDMREIWPGAPAQVGGFYIATAGAMAEVAERRGISGDIVIFHEYAHHFMRQYFRFACPSWYSEGFAEYVGTVKFEKNTVEIGRYDEGRAMNLSALPWVPFDQVLSRSPFDFNSEIARAQYYGQSWLLTHYLLRDPGRQAKLEEYLEAVADGEASWPAFRRIFGMDAPQLESRLKTYGHREMTYTRITMNLQSSTQVRAETMPASANELLLPGLSVAIGAAANGEGALVRIRKSAAAFSGDRFAQHTLALAEVVYGDPQKAIDALGDEARLGDDAEALYVFGYAKLRLAQRDASRRENLLEEARIAFVKAFSLDPDHYQTLYRYVQATYASAAPPPPSVLDVLVRAFLLAPQVDEISLAAASALMRAERFEEAILILESMANDPHNEHVARRARRLLDLARAKKPPDESNWEFKALHRYQ